jgi:hypothetical protein
MPSINISEFGGINTIDQYSRIVNKALTLSAEGVTQVGQLECVDMRNMDFVQAGIKKRTGSEAWGEDVPSGAELTDVMLTDDEILAFGVIDKLSEWHMLAVGKKTMYARSSEVSSSANAWRQIKTNNSTAANSVGYLYAEDANAASIVYLDGRLFIGLDGSNHIHVYSGYNGGEFIDCHLNASVTAGTPDSTTVDSDSAAAQKVLNVASTEFFSVNDRILINSGGAREEYGVVASITAGASLTLYDDLTYEHTAVQADEVIIQNTYREYDGTDQTIDGSWDTGKFILLSLQNRLCFSSGNQMWEYTDSPDTATSGIWKGSSNGFVIMQHDIKCMATFSPEFSDSFDEALYIGTESGFFIYSGALGSGTLIDVAGSKSPASRSAIAKTPNWLVYLSSDKQLVGISGVRTIDFGRRLKSKLDQAFISFGINNDIADNLFTTPTTEDVTIADGETKYVVGGILTVDSGDTVTVIGTLIILPTWYDYTAYTDPCFGYYNEYKKQLWFFYSVESGGEAGPKNTSCAVLDFQNGSVHQSMPLQEAEQVCRCAHWEYGTDPATDGTDWFIAMFEFRGKIFAVTPSGEIHKVYPDVTATQDIGSKDIDAFWHSPPFTAGNVTIYKHWMGLTGSFELETSGDADVDYYMDFDDTSSGSSTIDLDSGSRRLATGTNRINQKANAIEIRVSNSASTETFTMRNLNLQFEYGSAIRN